MVGVLGRVVWSCLALTALLCGAAHADVRVRGATTLAFGLMIPEKSNIERNASVTLELLPSSTMQGLEDLAQGRADIAMLAEPLETAAAAVNQNKPGLINLDDYLGRHVGDAGVQFIVHPSNPVRKVTKAELAALYTGRIRNWSELGGADQPVLLVGEPTSAPYRLIRDQLAVSYSPDLRIVQNPNQTMLIVAQAPGALSNISTVHGERSRFKVLETEVAIPLRLHLAIRKDASAEIVRAFEAAAAIGAP